MDQRSVHKHFALLEKRYTKKVSQHEKASGISPPETELDILLDEILLKIKEYEEIKSIKKKNVKGKKLWLKIYVKNVWKVLLRRLNKNRIQRICDEAGTTSKEKYILEVKHFNIFVKKMRKECIWRNKKWKIKERAKPVSNAHETTTRNATV